MSATAAGAAVAYSAVMNPSTDLPTADLYDEHLDALEVLALPWRSFGGRRRFQGPAQTVRCFNDNTMVRAQLETPGDGRVLVVDGAESGTHALLGDRLGELGVGNGWAGLVIAGYVRDTAALAQLDLGVAALGSIPRKSRKEDSGVVGDQVVIGGGRVAPGDTVVVDGDGVVVLPAALLD